MTFFAIATQSPLPGQAPAACVIVGFIPHGLRALPLDLFTASFRRIPWSPEDDARARVPESRNFVGLRFQCPGLSAISLACSIAAVLIKDGLRIWIRFLNVKD